MSTYLGTRTDDGEPPALRRSGIDCAEANDLIPALALGAIETGERHALRLHCQSCPACADTLDASQRVTAFLPFAGPSLAPPDRVKQHLFARIADAQPAAAFNSPALTTSLTIDAPVIDSPASKRSRSDAGLTRPSDREAGSSPWALPIWSSRVTRLAAGPLALALVLVTLYSLQVFDPSPDDTVDSSSQTGETAQVSSDTTASDVAQAEKPFGASFGNVTFGAASQAVTSTEPVFQTYAANSSEAFTYRALSTTGSQTELLRAVAPNNAACTLVATIGSRGYALSVTNLRLPGNGQIAGVYLVTSGGEQVYVGALFIDEQGNGEITFSINQPIEDFRSLQIGPVSQEPGALVDAPFFSAASFPFSWNDAETGLALAS